MKNLNSATVLIAISCTMPCFSAEIYRWTDEFGKVHIEDTVPEKYRRSAKKFDSSKFELTQAQKDEAAARQARSIKPAPAPSTGSEAASDPISSGTAAPPQQRQEAANDCEAQMEAYKRSGECFAPYRVKNGGIKAEAFQHCTEMRQPKCN